MIPADCFCFLSVLLCTQIFMIDVINATKRSRKTVPIPLPLFLSRLISSGGAISTVSVLRADVKASYINLKGRYFVQEDKLLNPQACKYLLLVCWWIILVYGDQQCPLNIVSIGIILLLFFAVILITSEIHVAHKNTT